MKENQSKGNGWRKGGFIGVLLLSAFCCGGPASFAALGGLGIGAIFAGASGIWWISGIFIAMAIVVTAVVIRKKRKHADVNNFDTR